MVASPACLRQHGMPRALEALGAHRRIVFRVLGRDRPQQFRLDGHIVTREPTPAQRFKGEAMVQAAVLGLGLAQISSYMADEDLAGGRLQEVLRPHRPPAMPIYAMTPGNRMMPSRVRVLLAALEDLHALPQPRGSA